MIKKVRKSYNTLKWVSGIMLFFILLLVAASRHLSVRFQPIIKAQVRDLVLNATDSLYSIEFSDVSTNFITGRASLSDVKITPDTNILKKMVGLKHAPNNIYYIQLKELAIKNFHPFNLLRYKKVKIDLLLFDNPEIIMVNKQLEFNELKKSFSDKSPYDYISKFVKELKVKTIDLKNISFKYVNKNLAVPEVDSIKNLNVTLKNWLIDKNSVRDTSRFYLLKDVVINLNNYSFATPDSLYHINLNQLDFRASSGKLNIKSFSVVPRYTEMDFGRTVGFSKDRFDIQMSNISLEGINLPLYVRKQELYATEMNVDNGSVSVFNNNELPKKTEIKIGKYPHQLLQKFKGLLTIKQLNLSNVDLTYAEFDRASKQKGRITFEKTSGSITNITNSQKIKSKNPYMFANLTSYMMGQGKLNVNFRFDLTANDGAFSYSGTLGEMDGRTLNRITKPLGMVEVKSGRVKKLEFDITANDNLAKGKVKFAFNDLSVALLKKEEGRDHLVKQGLMSFLANAMIINSDNPKSDGVLIATPIKFERQKTASFFSFIWKTLFQGIKHSVGVTPEKEKKIKEQIAKFEKIKVDREKRRMIRLKRKAIREKNGL